MNTLGFSYLRRRAVTTAMSTAAQVAARFHGLTPSARQFEARGEGQVHRDVPYSSAQTPPTAGLLDVYQPAHARPPGAPRPVVLYLHGGGFCLGSKATHAHMARQFAQAGYVVVLPNYRLAPKHPFPAACEDVAEAYTWVAEHARNYGGDLGQLVLAGDSAGANLVLGLMLGACIPRPEPWLQQVWACQVVPRLVMPAAGLLQVRDTARFACAQPRLHAVIQARLESIETYYLGKTSDGANATPDFADPLCILEHTALAVASQSSRPWPYVFATSGANDPILADTQRLGVALDRLGVPSRVAYYADSGHAFQALPWHHQAQVWWQDTLAVMGKVLMVPAAHSGSAIP